MPFLILKNYTKEIGVLIILTLVGHLGNFIGLDTYFGYLLVALLVFLKKSEIFLAIDVEGLIILLFSVTYSLFNAFSENKGVQFLIIQAIFPFIFYQLGKILVSKNITNQQLVWVIVAIGFCFSLTAILSVGKSLLTDGFIASERGVPSFWDGKELQATGASPNLIFNLLLPGILLVNKNRVKLSLLIVLLGIFILSLLCTFRLGSRTNLVIVAIGLVVGYVQVLLNQNIRQNLRFIFISIIVGALSIKFLPFDPNADYFSVLGERLTSGNASSIGTAGNRTQLWETAIENFKKHPLGWGGHHFAHNTWLDIARIAGVIPFVLFILSNIICLKNLFFIFRNKNYDTGVSISFILYILSCFLVFFGEPMIVGNFYLISLSFLFQGMLKKYILTMKTLDKAKSNELSLKDIPV